MDNIFRDQVIKIAGKERMLKKKPFEEIFDFHNPPILCVGASGTGKTTIAIDLIFKFAKEASRIYYISATKNSINEPAIGSIPLLFRRSPSVEDLDHVWNEIKSTAELSTVEPKVLLALIGKIYPQQDINTINTEIIKYRKDLENELNETYKELSEADRKQQIKNDIDTCEVEILTRLILNGIEIYGLGKIDDNEMNLVSTLVSSEQKTILILDDVSSELQMLKTSKKKYNYNGSPVNSSDVYKSILTDILTKARHYNCICVIFVHGWNIIDAKALTTNFIILDSTAASNMRLLRSVSDVAIKATQAASELVFSKYKHHFIVVKNGGEDVCVGKAELHIGETLELSKLNKNLLYAYNEIINNTNIGDINGELNKPLDNSSEDEEESGSEEISLDEI